MYNLTWEEAQKAMSEGKKVEHEYFCSGEWFEMKYDTIYCEDGYDMTGWYTGDDWQKTGWRVIDGV